MLSHVQQQALNFGEYSSSAMDDIGDGIYHTVRIVAAVSNGQGERS